MRYKGWGSRTHSLPEGIPGMSSELCEMSLQQTKELLRLTDVTLQSICCRRFTDEALYVEALQRVLGGAGRRGPASIFLGVFDPLADRCCGRVWHLRDGRMVEGSEEIVLEGAATCLQGLATAQSVTSNAPGTPVGFAEFQGHFPPAIRAQLSGAIRNFAAYRVSGELPGMLIAFNYPGTATTYDADVLENLAVVIGSLVTLSNEVRETEQAFNYTIEALARACEAAEEQTGRHITRVNRYAGTLAANLGLPADYVATVAFSAQMHDVGKIKIPAAILLKEGPLDEAEMELMKMHPVYGERILGDSPRLQVAREIAIAHHENWDGSGYPSGLKGEGIPLAGRITKVADVYDALRSRRSYKAPLSHAEALRVFREGDERVHPRAHFDPELLAVFFRTEHLFERIYASVEDEQIPL